VAYINLKDANLKLNSFETGPLPTQYMLSANFFTFSFAQATPSARDTMASIHTIITILMIPTNITV